MLATPWKRITQHTHLFQKGCNAVGSSPRRERPRPREARKAPQRNGPRDPDRTPTPRPVPPQTGDGRALRPHHGPGPAATERAPPGGAPAPVPALRLRGEAVTGGLAQSARTSAPPSFPPSLRPRKTGTPRPPPTCEPQSRASRASGAPAMASKGPAAASASQRPGRGGAAAAEPRCHGSHVTAAPTLPCGGGLPPPAPSASAGLPEVVPAPSRAAQRRDRLERAQRCPAEASNVSTRRLGAERGGVRLEFPPFPRRHRCCGQRGAGPSAPRSDVTGARQRRGRAGWVGRAVGGSGLRAAPSSPRPPRPAAPRSPAAPRKRLSPRPPGSTGGGAASYGAWRRPAGGRGRPGPRRRVLRGAPRRVAAGSLRGRFKRPWLPRPLRRQPFAFLGRREQPRNAQWAGAGLRRGGEQQPAVRFCLLRCVQHRRGVSAKFRGAEKIQGCLSCSAAAAFLLLLLLFLKKKKKILYA